jgi:ATP-binding cassette subfamily C (CFTR/MRP) protein 1
MLVVRCPKDTLSPERRRLTKAANALGLFTPAVTIILFAALGNAKLDAETAYTTLAILTMVTHPANMVMTMIPRAIASLASFQRIQDFISKPHFKDTRLCLERAAGATSTEVAVELKDVELRLTGSTTPSLQNIDLRIENGSIVVCTGFTGVGKSILGLAITGEITPSKGSVSTISKRTGLCAQSPWLPGQSISGTI